MMCKQLSIPGGSTKIQAMWTVTKNVIDSGYMPDLIDGVSSGALLSVPAALYSVNPYHPVIWRLEKVLSEIHKDNFWKVKPGSFRSIIRAATLRESIWVMRLDEIIRDTITARDFNDYQTGPYPICWVMSVNEDTGAREFVNLKECSYQQYLNAVVSSSSIPPFAMSVNGLIDGGVRDHSIGAWVMDRYQPTECVSIWSRPKDLSGVLSTMKNNNWISRLIRAFQILIFEISKSDEQIQRITAAENGVHYRALYLPKILKGMYDTDKSRLKELNEAAKKITL